MVFVKQLELLIKSLGSYKCPMRVCGELNIDTLKSYMQTEKFLKVIEGNGYMILSKDVTLVKHQSITCIDLIIMRNNEIYEFNVMQD